MPLTPDEGNKREQLFLSEVRRQKQVWVLQRDGGFANWTEDDSTVVPVWAQESEAQRCAARSFPTYHVHAIALKEFMEDLLPRFAERQIWLAVNPTANLAGNQLPADRLAAALGQNGG